MSHDIATTAVNIKIINFLIRFPPHFHVSATSRTAAKILENQEIVFKKKKNFLFLFLIAGFSFF